VHVPGLAQAVSELTLAHTQVLLAVPMEGLGSCSAFTIRLEDAMDFPLGTIAHQNFARLRCPFARPEHHNPYWMRKRRNVDGLGKILLGLAPNGDLFPAEWPQVGGDPVVHLPGSAVDDDVPIGL
jgi:hypothetical protein